MTDIADITIEINGKIAFLDRVIYLSIYFDSNVIMICKVNFVINWVHIFKVSGIKNYHFLSQRPQFNTIKIIKTGFVKYWESYIETQDGLQLCWQYELHMLEIVLKHKLTELGYQYDDKEPSSSFKNQRANRFNKTAEHFTWISSLWFYNQIS